MKTVLIAGIAATLLASSLAAQDVTWRVTSTYPSKSHVGASFDAMAKELSRLTDGGFILELNLDGALGFKGGDNFEVVGDGVVEMAETGAPDLIGFEQVFGVVGLPFIAPTNADIQRMMKIVRPEFEAAFERNDQKMIGWGTFPAVGIFGKHKMTSIEDFAGVKIRTYDSFSASAFKELSAAPVQLAWSDVVSSLSSGVIDSVLTSSFGGFAIKAWDLGITDFSDIGYSTPITLLHVSKDAFDDLSPEYQEALLTAAEVYTETNWKEALAAIEGFKKTFRENGITIHEAADAKLTARFAGISRAAAADWIKEAGPKGEVLFKAIQDK
ncbi:TRAP transporter substrate-binding protein DctP [Rhodobacteraceae bacterium D3-12]|nr:TRAP transporter substrate-binding protein DctP [Rhodobacteraceae bacterium D3-12]